MAGNDFGGFGSGFGQGSTPPQAPGFEQMNQEFYQSAQQPYQGQGFGQPQYSGFEQNQGFGQPDLQGFEQPAQGFGQPDQGFGQPAQGFGKPDQGFGQPAQGFGQPDQGFGQPAQGFGQPDQGFEQPAQGFGQPAQGMGGHTPPPGWANPSAPTDPFGGVSQPRQQAEPELRWWQKGARVFLIGGAAVLILAILVFVIATNLNKRSVENPPAVNLPQIEQSQVEQPQVEQPQVEQPQAEQPQVEQPQTPVTPQPDPKQWQLIGNTNGYDFVETRLGEFVVKDLQLYFRNDGGVQVRSVAVGTLDGYPGVYEVEVPRSAALFDSITVGYKFIVSFDVYKAADSKDIFIENIRPEK
jgi:hypothetical protein